MLGKAGTHTTYPSTQWHQSTSPVTHQTARFKLLVPSQGKVVDKGTRPLLHPCWFSTMASPPRSRPLKMGTHMLCCQYSIAKTQRAYMVRRNGVAGRQRAQHPFLGVPSALADQALGYSLYKDMNSPFSLPIPETLAALLKHKHDQDECGCKSGSATPAFLLQHDQMAALLTEHAGHERISHLPPPSR